MKKLIINADDFGLSSSVNRGIIAVHQKEVVTSTTLMANMPGFLDAVQRAKENPSLGVGVHLNIYRGRPLCRKNQVSSLVDLEGNFFASPELVKRIYRKRIKAQELALELKNQIAKVQEAGIKITHLDSEKHFHIFPHILPVVLRVAKHFQIKKMRLPDQHFQFSDLRFLGSAQFYKMLYLNLRSRRALPLIQRSGILYPDRFLGIFVTQQISLRAFAAFFKNLRPGVTEMMVHPGYVDRRLRALSQRLGYSMLESRREELNVLLRPAFRELIERNKIKLVNYREI